jgi:hypothetical protein
MTPQEKAKELVREFKKYAYYPKTKDDEIFVNELKTNAKQCALIAVDEMFKEISKWAGGEFQEWEKERWKYLQEVKQEIELL